MKIKKFYWADYLVMVYSGLVILFNLLGLLIINHYNQNKPTNIIGEYEYVVNGVTIPKLTLLNVFEASSLIILMSLFLYYFIKRDIKNFKLLGYLAFGMEAVYSLIEFQIIGMIIPLLIVGYLYSLDIKKTKF